MPSRDITVLMLFVISTAKIERGSIQVSDRPGLGVELDMDRIESANRLYESMGNGERDDAVAMQYLIPRWRFDHKRPCLLG